MHARPVPAKAIQSPHPHTNIRLLDGFMNLSLCHVRKEKSREPESGMTIPVTRPRQYMESKMSDGMPGFKPECGYLSHRSKG